MCFTVEYFCCCLSLELGAQVISIVSTLMSAVITALYGSAAGFLQLSQARLLFYLAMAITAGLQCILGAVLSFGAFQRRALYMWPWLMLTWTTSLALLSVSIAGAMYLLVQGFLTQDAYVIVSAYVAYSLFQLYCASVVNSRRLELLKERESESARTLMRYPNAWKYA